MNAPIRVVSDQAGFSLLEVLLAVIVLTIGLIGLAGSTTYVIRQVTVAELKTERTMAVQTAVERIRSAGHGELPSGADTVGDFVVRWASEPVTTNLSRVRLISVGPGLTTGPNGGPALGDAVADTTIYSIVKR